MHDPSTVAFDIKYPWRSSHKSKMWPKGYRNTFITIWHVDPEDARGMCGIRRRDDTCGWFTPPYPQKDHDRIAKLAKQQYSHIWEKQNAITKGKDYARICFEPSVYDAIYWAWRAIKYSENGPGRWMYGEQRPALTPRELEEIYLLDSNPVNNLRMRVAGVKDEETCVEFFLLLYGIYLHHRRPWYRHPRWHIHHWRLQVHPWQKLRRWLFSRCAGCGKRFPWGYSPVSHQWDSPPLKLFRGEEGVYHSECSGMTMKLHKEPPAGSA